MTRRLPARATVHARKVAAALYAPEGEIPAKPERRKPRDLEGPIHVDILKYLRAVLPRNSLVFHVPAGGQRASKVNAKGARYSPAGQKLQKLGAVAGIPDLCLIVLGKVYFIEVKAQNGRPSDEQVAVFGALERAGACVAVARSADEVRDIVRRWGIPTREVTP